MSENTNLHGKELRALLEERSRIILKRYEQTAIENVKNPKLLAILTDVKKYWSSSKSAFQDLIRPALTSLCCEAVGGDPEKADEACLMFTLASSGFGIHDDILDKSVSKHFRATILGLHGIDGALLVGDLLLVKAWAVIHDMIKKNLDPMKIAEIIEEYSRFSVEICEAEFMESSCRRNFEMDLDYYLNILWQAMGETAACCKIGAILGDGKPFEVKALAEFGRRLGFTYRLTNDVEDCLNLRGDFIHRLEYESVPLPLLYAAKSSPEKYIRIKRILEKTKIDPLDVKELLGLCFETEAFQYVCKKARANVEEAANKLSSLEPSGARNLLLLVNNVSYQRLSKLCI